MLQNTIMNHKKIIIITLKCEIAQVQGKKNAQSSTEWKKNY